MLSSESGLSIDITGAWSGPTGWATHSMGFARAMRARADVLFRARNFKECIMGLISRDRGMFLRGPGKQSGDFGVVIIGEPMCPERSARWVVWETTVLPPGMRSLCDRIGFVWTPSCWGRDMLIANGIAQDRVAVVPEGVDTDFYRPAHVQSGKRRFRFLMVGKWEERKCIDGLVRAFDAEFSPREDVELYLLADNPYIPHFSIGEQLEKTGVSNRSAIVCGRPCSKRALRALYQSADCFVLPTRAEGWGLPVLESMACGVPAIVTGYSAPLDYMSDENGYLLRVARMVAARDPLFNISTGQWADPDCAHLRFLMRHCFENPTELREKGRAARATAERFSWNNAAQVALQAIERHLRVCG